MTHLPLERRKELAARLVFWEAVKPLEGTFRQQGASAQYRDLDNHLASSLRLHSQKDNKQELAKYVHNVFAEFEKLAETTLQNTPSLRKSTNKSIQSALKNVSCKKCHQALKGNFTICNGFRADNKIVVAGGRCIKPLKQLFEVAVELGRAYYTTYCTLPLTFPATILSTRFEKLLNWHINGETDYLQNGAAAIGLVVDTEKLTWESYMALLYLFLHEIIAHAYTEIVPNPAGRALSAPHEAFAEGWMDYIAYLVMEDAINGNYNKAMQHLNFRHEHFDHGRAMHLARRDEDSPDGIKRRFGAEAALRLHDLLKLTKKRDEALEWIFRISFDINVLRDIGHDQKSRFAGTIYRALLPLQFSPLKPTRELEKAISLLKEHMRSPDARKLVFEMLMM